MYCEEYVLRVSTLISMFCFFYPERQETFISGEYMLYVVLDFTQPVTKYHVATSTSRNYLHLLMYTPQALH